MSKKQKLWYQYSRAFLVGFGIAFLITVITIILHLAVYGIMPNEFEMFFGVAIGKFVWWKYTIYFMFWTFIFTLVFRNEWKLC